jgi:hypothetical protein
VDGTNLMSELGATQDALIGLLAHRPQLGAGVWEYLWLLAHVTAQVADGNGGWEGLVEGGRPVPTLRIARELRRSRETTLVNLGKLEAGNYINRSAAPGHAYSYRVILVPKTDVFRTR